MKGYFLENYQNKNKEKLIRTNNENKINDELKLINTELNSIKNIKINIMDCYWNYLYSNNN